LRGAGVVQGTEEWFSPLAFGGTVEDDQLPVCRVSLFFCAGLMVRQFIERGVNVLHVIPYPFPTVWHTIKVRLLSYCSQSSG
jgi:hypothetical protein